MNFQNKIFKIFLIMIFIFLAVDWSLRKMGYPITGYQYNMYHNTINNRVINSEKYSLVLPFFTWRISSTDKKNIKLKGIVTGNTVLSAILRDNFMNKDIMFIKGMCKNTPKIMIEEINAIKVYDMYCEKANIHLKKLEPFRIYWVENHAFLLMSNYKEEHKDTYNELISSIEVK